VRTDKFDPISYQPSILPSSATALQHNDIAFDRTIADGVHEPYTMCESPNSKLCGQCKSTRYCSKKCQKADWVTHKHLCATFGNFDLTTRPYKSHFLAVSFPVDEDKPKLFWLQYLFDWVPDPKLGVKYYEGYCEGPEQWPREFSGMFDPGSPNPYTLKTNPVTGKPFPESKQVKILAYDDVAIGDHTQNQCIRNLTPNDLQVSQHWAGPTAAYSDHYIPFARKLTALVCRDFNMTDFHQLVAYLGVYAKTPSEHFSSARTEQFSVNALKVLIRKATAAKEASKQHANRRSEEGSRTSSKQSSKQVWT
jgi:hypothetical protein